MNVGRMPRPEGFDYSQPDPQEVRCPRCNQDGMNRTGLAPWGYVGATTLGMWGVPCPKNCTKGLVEVIHRAE